jgi:hypothetical protein
MKKNTIGVSALVAFGINGGYNFQPLKKYDANHPFFGIKSEKAFPTTEDPTLPL